MKQEKTTKILEMILLILIIVLIITISFFGILRKNLNSWYNKIPDYELGKELSKMRVLTFSVDTSTKEIEDTENTDETSTDVDKTVSNDDKKDTSKDKEKNDDDKKDSEKSEEKKEEPVNPKENLTKENYEKAKDIIEKRLAKAEITDSEVVVNKESGDINIYVPFNDTANRVANYVTGQGKIEIVDSKTNEVLIPQSMIKSVSKYSTLSSQDEEDTSTTENKSNETKYDFGLTISFTNEGINKLSEVTKTYIDVLNDKGESDPKTVALKIDDETVYTTYFDPDGAYTELNIPIFSGVTDQQYDAYRENIEVYETNISSGLLPIVYTANETTFLDNDFNKTIIFIGIIVFAIITLIIGIILITKYKGKGLLGFISQIGYIATYLILIRITKETLTIFGMISLAALTLINFMFIAKLIYDKKNSFVKKSIDLALKLIPVIIVAIVFVFASSIELKSVGAVLFWGLLILIPYNLIFTENLLSIKKHLEKIGGKNSERN